MLANTCVPVAAHAKIFLYTVPKQYSEYNMNNAEKIQSRFDTSSCFRALMDEFKVYKRTVDRISGRAMYARLDETYTLPAINAELAFLAECGFGDYAVPTDQNEGGQINLHIRHKEVAAMVAGYVSSFGRRVVTNANDLALRNEFWAMRDEVRKAGEAMRSASTPDEMSVAAADWQAARELVEGIIGKMTDPKLAASARSNFATWI